VSVPTRAPSRTRTVADVAADLVSVLNDRVNPGSHPLDRYLEHLRLRHILQEAAKLMTAECGSDLAAAMESGMAPKDIREALAAEGVTLSSDGISYLKATAIERSVTRQ
jgi:hypothetical protein